MRKSDIAVIAVWAAMIFGLMEGIVLSVSRAYPTILAPYKVSLHVLWIAPIVDLLLFLLVAVGLPVLVRRAGKWLNASESLVVYGIFFCLGIFSLIDALKIIHLISAVVLSLGLTVVFCRKLSGSENRLTNYLRGRLVWIPVLIITAGVGVSVYAKANEMWLFRQLPPAPAGMMNVLAIVMDTVRGDSFIRTGENSITPNLSRIAASGMRFESAWATSSWSLPSQASILTGRYPHEHRADWPHLQLDEQYPTLAQFFAGRGYVTGAFSGNAAWMTPEYLGRGFLRFDVYTLEALLRRTVYGRKVDRLLWEVGYHSAGRGKKAPELNAQLLKFLDDYRGRPFFAYICYMDVNQAFHDRWLNYGFLKKAPPMREVFQAYEQGLRVLDTQISDLFAELQRRGILDSTLVIITADHGQSFGAEGTNGYDHDPRGHGTSLYPEQTKVPLFVIYPDKVPAGQKVMFTVSLRQIPGMITFLLGLEDSPFARDSLPIGWDKKQALEGHEAPVLVTLNYKGRRVQSVKWDRWLYINNSGDPHKGEELYDLAADPLAKKNLATTSPILARMRETLQQLLTTEAPSTMLSGPFHK